MVGRVSGNSWRVFLLGKIAGWRYNIIWYFVYVRILLFAVHATF